VGGDGWGGLYHHPTWMMDLPKQTERLHVDALRASRSSGHCVTAAKGAWQQIHQCESHQVFPRHATSCRCVCWMYTHLDHPKDFLGSSCMCAGLGMGARVHVQLRIPLRVQVLPQPPVRVRWLVLMVGMQKQGLGSVAYVSSLWAPLAEVSRVCGVSQRLLISHIMLISG